MEDLPISSFTAEITKCIRGCLPGVRIDIPGDLTKYRDPIMALPRIVQDVIACCCVWAGSCNW